MLYNRKIAVLALAVMVVASSLFGSHRSLMKYRNEAETLFYQGDMGDGHSIQSDLEARAALAYNLTTVAKNYLPESDSGIQDVLSARQSLLDADNLPDKYAANRRLSETTDALIAKLGALELSDSDQRYRGTIATDLASRNTTIAKDSYNLYAENFNRKLGAFPANVLGPITSVKPLELFS